MRRRKKGELVEGGEMENRSEVVLLHKLRRRSVDLPPIEAAIVVYLCEIRAAFTPKPSPKTQFPRFLRSVWYPVSTVIFYGINPPDT